MGISAHTVLESQKVREVRKEKKQGKEGKKRREKVYGRQDVSRRRNGVFTEDNGSMG